MRIDELVFPKTKASASKVLQKYGYELLGSGYYGKVFKKPGETSVLKLFDKKDIAYINYVDFCRANKNEHFPKFSRGVVDIKGTKYDAVRTELLEEGDSNYLTKVANYLHLYVWSVQNFRDTEGLERHKKYYPGYEEWIESNQSVVEACDLMIKAFSKTTFKFDFKDDNIMYRGTTLVLSDSIRI